MSINFTEKPEMNVVNVGDEISSDQLAAIQNAANPSASNPLATIADVGSGGGGGGALSFPTTISDTLEGGLYQVEFQINQENLHWSTYSPEMGYDTLSISKQDGIYYTNSYGNYNQWHFTPYGFKTYSNSNNAGIIGNNSDYYATSSISVIGGSNTTVIGNTGITFPDGSFQSTAASGGSGGAQKIWNFEYSHQISASSYSETVSQMLSRLSMSSFEGWTNAITQGGLFKTKISIVITSTGGASGCTSPEFYSINNLSPAGAYNGSYNANLINGWFPALTYVDSNGGYVFTWTAEFAGSYEAYSMVIPAFNISSDGTLQYLRVGIQVESITQ